MFGRAGLVNHWLSIGKYSSVLDVGCGDASHLMMVNNETTTLAGIDPDIQSIEEAKKNFPNGIFKVGYAEKLPFQDNTFDCVLFSDVIEHVSDDRKSLKEICRVLKPNGKLLLTTPHLGLFFLLDPLNYSYFISKLLRRNPKKPYHRHYSLNRLNVLLSEAGFDQPSLIHRGGLLLTPLVYNLEILSSLIIGSGSKRGFKIIKKSLGEIEFKTNFGPLGYYIALVVTKK